MIFASKRTISSQNRQFPHFFTVVFYTTYFLVALQLFAIFAKYGHS